MEIGQESAAKDRPVFSHFALSPSTFPASGATAMFAAENFDSSDYGGCGCEVD